MQDKLIETCIRHFPMCFYENGDLIQGLSSQRLQYQLCIDVEGHHQLNNLVMLNAHKIENAPNFETKNMEKMGQIESVGTFGSCGAEKTEEYYSVINKSNQYDISEKFDFYDPNEAPLICGDLQFQESVVYSYIQLSSHQSFDNQQIEHKKIEFTFEDKNQQKQHQKIEIKSQKLVKPIIELTNWSPDDPFIIIKAKKPRKHKTIRTGLSKYKLKKLEKLKIIELNSLPLQRIPQKTLNCKKIERLSKKKKSNISKKQQINRLSNNNSCNIIQQIKKNRFADIKQWYYLDITSLKYITMIQMKRKMLLERQCKIFN